jgi:hypothetical protein
MVCFLVLNKCSNVSAEFTASIFMVIELVQIYAARVDIALHGNLIRESSS